MSENLGKTIETEESLYEQAAYNCESGGDRNALGVIPWNGQTTVVTNVNLDLDVLNKNNHNLAEALKTIL